MKRELCLPINLAYYNACNTTCMCKTFAIFTEPRCPPVCLVHCPFGNVYDENNCATCNCKTGKQFLLGILNDTCIIK